MRRKFKMLDLCCKAGGCSMGYYMAGFEVVGVDIEFQPRYPFRFIQSDMFDIDLSEYDFIHASPPCQGYSITRHLHKEKAHDLLVDRVRTFLKASGKPYVIENVVGAPLINPISLNGYMFGLQVKRTRLFESNVPLYLPTRYYLGGIIPEKVYDVTGNSGGTIEEWREAMGINWMVKKEITQAIPPLYTEWIGTQLMNYLLSDDQGVFVDVPG